MNTQPQSVFRTLAAQRWPTAAIHGDGEWVCLVECYQAKGAFLFSDADSASGYAAADCGHATCRRAHTVVRLKPLTLSKMRDIGYRDKKD